jgi:hypothetical protein
MARLKRYRSNEYARNNGIVGRVVLYAVRAIWRKVGDYFFPELLVVLHFYLRADFFYVDIPVITSKFWTNGTIAIVDL